MPYELFPLPYPTDALEPYIDKETVAIHHGKHHQGYVNKLNKALEDFPNSPNTLVELFYDIAQYPASIRNNAGGAYNHALFWKIMSPEIRDEPSGSFREALQAKFGSIAHFKKTFSQAAATHFGSGWVWLSLALPSKELTISTTPNQDNPLMGLQGIPLLCLDVWEHAYYLQYQNRRADYIQAWWNIVNWDEVSARFAEFRKIDSSMLRRGIMLP